MQECLPDQKIPRKTRLAERQARVGIIANTSLISLPIQPPREVWTRWPKLRSGRRAGQRPATQSGVPSQGAMPAGDMLDAFRRDLRRQADDTPVHNYPSEVTSPETPPPVRVQPVTILAVSVLAGAMGLIGLSFVVE